MHLATSVIFCYFKCFSLHYIKWFITAVKKNYSNFFLHCRLPWHKLQLQKHFLVKLYSYKQHKTKEVDLMKSCCSIAEQCSPVRDWGGMWVNSGRGLTLQQEQNPKSFNAEEGYILNTINLLIYVILLTFLQKNNK